MGSSEEEGGSRMGRRRGKASMCSQLASLQLTPMELNSKNYIQCCPTWRAKAGLLYSHLSHWGRQELGVGGYTASLSPALAGPRSPEKEQLKDVSCPPSGQLGDSSICRPEKGIWADLTLLLSPIPSHVCNFHSWSHSSCRVE